MFNTNCWRGTEKFECIMLFSKLDLNMGYCQTELYKTIMSYNILFLANICSRGWLLEFPQHLKNFRNVLAAFQNLKLVEVILKIIFWTITNRKNSKRCEMMVGIWMILRNSDLSLNRVKAGTIVLTVTKIDILLTKGTKSIIG